MKLIYVCSPYAGDIDANVRFAKDACRFVMRKGHAFFAPHLLYPTILDDSIMDERKLGMNMGLLMLRKCDELWVFGSRISSGMQAEIEEASQLGIPVKPIALTSVYKS